jgi:nucleotide-binding universal stress UspA family protein
VAAVIKMTTKPVVQVGIDGSWRDSGALQWALQECLLRHEPLRAVHVIEDRLRNAPYWEPTVIDDSALRLAGEVQEHLDIIDRTATSEGGIALEHETDLVVGPPATTLAGLAEGSRMLVVGRRGVGAFKRLLIGSTSEAVANQADVPVVVVPDGWKPLKDAGDAGDAGPVLVGVDDSDDNDAAIEFAVEAAGLRHVQLRMVHVWDLPSTYSWDAMNVAGLSSEWEDSAKRHFAEVAERWRLKYPEADLEVEVTRGHPVEGLLVAAESTGAQLVVLGGRSHNRVTAALMGSVARGVLHHATRPVVIVHTRRDQS